MTLTGLAGCVTEVTTHNKMALLVVFMQEVVCPDKPDFTWNGLWMYFPLGPKAWTTPYIFVVIFCLETNCVRAIYRRLPCPDGAGGDLFCNGLIEHSHWTYMSLPQVSLARRCVEHSHPLFKWRTVYSNLYPANYWD